jgi:hypothetical protein
MPKKQNREGKRPGAGRKPCDGETTKAVRMYIPASKATWVQAYECISAWFKNSPFKVTPKMSHF